MRDRLMELLNEVRFIQGDMMEQIADHLIANSVIVPPCKVGDIIYALTYDCDDYVPLEVTSRASLVLWMDEGQFGRELFTTCEEAEQAMKGENHAKIH